jgi:hypothetical protein
VVPGREADSPLALDLRGSGSSDLGHPRGRNKRAEAHRRSRPGRLVSRRRAVRLRFLHRPQSNRARSGTSRRRQRSPSASGLERHGPAHVVTRRQATRLCHGQQPGCGPSRRQRCPPSDERRHRHSSLVAGRQLDRVHTRAAAGSPGRGHQAGRQRRAERRGCVRSGLAPPRAAALPPPTLRCPRDFTGGRHPRHQQGRCDPCRPRC